MEKQQLIKFIAKVMEDSGFNVYTNFKTTKQNVDIYAVLPSSTGEIGVVVACKNYEEEFDVGVDVLMEMEEVKDLLNASKITIVTSSSFSPEAIRYSELKNIKLVDREGLIELAKKYKKNNKPQEEPDVGANRIPEDIETGKDEIIRPTTTEQTPDDEEVVREFLNRDYIPPETTNTNRSFFRGKNSAKNSSGSILNKQTQNNNGGRQFISNRPNLSGGINSPNIRMPSFLERLRPYLSNTIVLIILVVIISYLISTLLTMFTGISTAIAGAVELLIALALSYGFVLLFDRESAQILIKGTIIFFISLILLMLLVIL